MGFSLPKISLDVVGRAKDILKEILEEFFDTKNLLECRRSWDSPRRILRGEFSNG